VTVVTNSRVFSTREAAGASGARHSLRPLFPEGGTSRQNSGASRREIAAVYAELEQRHCERSEAIYSWFLLPHGLLRRFAPRNDGQLTKLSWLFEI
jgi:hypothetical protein